MLDRGHLLTEQRNPASRHLDEMTLDAAFDVMNTEDQRIPSAVAAAKREIVAAIEMVARAFEGGGRLIYIGAGTSGRLGVLDATECPPTFLTPPEMVQGIIAGGPAALVRSIEGAEDDPSAGAAEIDCANVTSADVVFGIAAGGTTPFVHGAIRRAHERGARTIFLACVPREQADDHADISIRVLTGPEVLSGSTRLKAGLATKMVLNMISTLAMVRIGKVYENLMVDVSARACEKLTDRAIRTLCAATGLDRTAAHALLGRADWHVKTAIVMHHKRVEADAARDLLDKSGGKTRIALGAPER
ncbi:MAG: N-acetylmuramic acid 6-phosphate etherase [Phycisphaerales bacterium]|nr:N-acetylmuramic acid 6-phosphate etherase [Phycisphaerales bacterium]